MAIVLFTDFGAADVYVGQVELVLDRLAPGVKIVHLLHDAPVFDIEASAHLLAALAQRLRDGDVLIGVVDPGVGTARHACAVEADGCWFVGPDNSLFSVLAARASSVRCWRLAEAAGSVSASFHGRDLFAPVAAAIARTGAPPVGAQRVDSLDVRSDAGDLARIIYVDHYGNCFTGIRASERQRDRTLMAAGLSIASARVFGDVPAGKPFWYANSIGLVEIAVNRGHAARELGLAIGSTVAWKA